MACGHVFIRINDVSVCIKCGLTLGKGCVIFDHQLINWKGGQKKRHGKRK